ncbi:MAG: hypothetical protein COB04_02980 [Gammaproteobacteria bacterium]|nr:MAG: hypothetical protein COB04_02980 [Gammaproteobacteria bacterium]
MSDKKNLDKNPFMDQDKIIRMVRILIKSVENLPDNDQRDAIWGGLEAVLDELNKPLLNESSIVH